MKFFRNNWYWILGIVIGISISTVILIQRGDQQDVETNQQGSSVKPEQQNITQVSPKIAAKPPPPGETAETGFWHGGHWHETPDTPSPGARNKAIPIPAHSKRRGSIMDRISHGAVGLQPIMYSGAQMQQKRKWREMMDAGEITPEEYAEKILELTVGDMDTESAVRFYEKHGNYNTALLARLDTVNAFRHLKVLQEQSPHRISKLARKYAERVLSETASDSPEHFEAKLFLADTDTDFPRAVTLYRELLERDPDSQYIIHSVLKEAIPVRRHIYVHLGNRLWQNHPEEAIPYLKIAVQLDEPHGDYPMMSNHLLGYAYERIGDYKTAWVYHKRAYKKTGHWSPRDHFKAIEEGKPLHEPLRHGAPSRSQDSRTPVEAWDAFVTGTPETFQMDSDWENDILDQDTSPSAKFSYRFRACTRRRTSTRGIPKTSRTRTERVQ